MGRPRKIKFNDPTTQSISTATVTLLDTAQPASQAARYDLVLGVRRIRAGNFSGLWELSELTEEDGMVKSIRIMTDANIKPILIAQIGKRLNQCF